MHKKNLWSDTLKRPLEIEVSTKALKCIKKAGSLDKYLLKTDPEVMRSQYGNTLKSIIQKKIEDPEWEVPYIPRSWKKPKKRNALRQEWYKNSIYRPPELRNTDHTLDLFDVYDPNAPSRQELLKKQAGEEKTEAKSFDPDLNKLQRREDEDNNDELSKSLGTAQVLGIATEEDKKDKGAKKTQEKQVRKSRSRQLFEAKMKKIEKRLSGEDDKPDPAMLKKLKEDILRLKGVKK